MLVIRVRVKQVVGHVFQDGFDGFTGHLGACGVRIGDGGHVHQPLTGNGLTRQQGSTPPKAGRKGNFGTLDVHQCVQQQLIACATEVAAPVQEAVIHCQFFAQFGFKRRAHPGDQRVHFFVGWQHVGKYGQQPIFEILHFASPHVQIQHAQKLAIGARIGHDGFATGIRDQARNRHAVMRMPAHDGVNTGHAAGHFEVNVHAVVREQKYHLRTLGPRLVHGFLHALFLDAEAPIGHQVTRVGDRAIGKGLADDGHRNTVHLTQNIGLEDQVAKIVGFDVLCDELDLAVECLVNNLFHAFLPECELPMAGHQIHAQQLAGFDHVLPLGPQSGGAALPGVATVQQYRLWAIGLEAFDQGRHVGKTTHFAVAARGIFKIQIGQCMGLCRTRPHARCFEQMFPH